MGVKYIAQCTEKRLFMKFKMVHENYNVADLNKSIAFYEKALGLHEVRRKNGDGFIKGMWCGEEACEDEVKAKTGVGSRCVPLEQETVGEVCMCCGKPAKKMVLWAKAY